MRKNCLESQRHSQKLLEQGSRGGAGLEESFKIPGLETLDKHSIFRHNPLEPAPTNEGADIELCADPIKIPLGLHQFTLAHVPLPNLRYPNRTLGHNHRHYVPQPLLLSALAVPTVQLDPHLLLHLERHILHDLPEQGQWVVSPDSAG